MDDDYAKIMILSIIQGSSLQEEDQRQGRLSQTICKILIMMQFCQGEVVQKMETFETYAIRGRAHITESRIGGGVSPNDYSIT